MADGLHGSVAAEVEWDVPSAVPQTPKQGDFRKVESLKGEEGAVHRIAILTTKPVRTFSHYKEGYGYFACLKGEGQDCVACNAGSRVTEKYGVNILMYPPGTDGQGEWDVGGLRILMWQFNKDVKNDVVNLMKQWGPVTNYDLSITCTSKQFQKWSVVNCPASLWQTSQWASQIWEVIQRDQYDLLGILGRKESVDEVRRIWTQNVTRKQLYAEREAAKKGALFQRTAPAAPASPFAGLAAPAAPQTPSPFGGIGTNTAPAPAAASAPVAPATNPAAMPIPAIVPPAPTQAPAAMPNFRDLLSRNKPAA